MAKRFVESVEEGTAEDREEETLQFLNGPVEEDWKCPVCLELLNNPFLTECCGHHFCERCINIIQQQRNECPLCKEYPVRGIINKCLKRNINEAKVYCMLRPQGCDWTGELGNLNSHLSVGQQHGQCKYVIIPCPNDTCDMKCPRHEMKTHANKECEYRSFTCPYCSHKDIFLFIQHHHFPKCPDYPLTCPNKCTKNSIKRSNLQKHLCVCPNAMVPCPFSEVGCKAKVKRCNLKKHSDSNVTQHQNFICAAIVDLQKDNKTLQNNLQSDSEELFTELNSTQGRICSLEKKCSKLQSDLYNMTEKVDAQNKKLITELDQTKSYLQYLLSNYSEVQDSLSSVCKENKQLKHSFAALKAEVSELKSQLDTANQLSAARDSKMNRTLHSLMGEIKTTLRDEMANKMAPLQRDISSVSRQHYRIEYWFDGYKLMAQKMKQANWTLYLKTMGETVTQFPDPVSPVILHVNGYGQAKRDRKTLMTSSFYINASRGKYKFVLIIDLNRDNLIISASIMKGKYDNSITWPFSGTIVVTLLNHMEDKNHYSKEIWSTTDTPGLTYSGKVPPHRFRNPSWTRQYFITLAQLESSGDPCYLMNDSLYLEVNTSPRKTNDSTSEGYCCIS